MVVVVDLVVVYRCAGGAGAGVSGGGGDGVQCGGRIVDQSGHVSRTSDYIIRVSCSSYCCSIGIVGLIVVVVVVMVVLLVVLLVMVVVIGTAFPLRYVVAKCTQYGYSLR